MNQHTLWKMIYRRIQRMPNHRLWPSFEEFSNMKPPISFICTTEFSPNLSNFKNVISLIIKYSLYGYLSK